MKTLKVLLALALALEPVLFPVAGLYAQDAPAGDKDFAQDLQGPGGDEGGPILDSGPADSAPPSVMPQGQVPGSPIDSVQIGGAPKDAPMYEEVESVSPLDRKIGPIRLKGAPLSTFLDVVSAQSKVNFIITEGLETKTITVFLRKTTVREALELLLRVKGLTYQRIGKSNTYVVQRRSADMPNLITKIYTLNYIPLIPITSVGEEIASITSQDVSSNQQGGQQQGGGEEKGGEKESAISIINIVRSVLSKKNGKLATDPRTNTLIITDVPEVFPQVEQIIAELDKKAPQILIEAQIVEINTDRMNELGIEWGGSRGEMAYFAGPSRLTDYGLRPGFFSGDEWKKFFPKTSDIAGESGSGGSAGSVDPIFSTGQQSSKGVYYGVFSLAQLQAIFRALISKGEGRYLGKPKIVAMNNKTALITISKDAAMGTTSTVSSAGGSAGSSSSGVERRRIGLILKVTPQVNKEGYITMIVQPAYSDAVASAITVQGQTVYDPVSRGASTMVRVKNGQTVVIGGMLASTETKTIRKVPLLGYIPIIGWLFTSVSSRRTNTDLVIFLTPTILVD
ncbi:MAG: secretin N-terminal domain-containing protein [Elusimicrobiales bacterium]|nr:secretin N-terminal domain-containing protein [Elusimicrobiales bacterium]